MGKFGDNELERLDKAIASPSFKKLSAEKQAKLLKARQKVADMYEYHRRPETRAKQRKYHADRYRRERDEKLAILEELKKL